MQTQLPETVNFLRQVELNRTIEGVYSIAKLDRLKQVLHADAGVVTAKLEFGRSVGFNCLKGEISAQLLVECQRCLKPMATKISGSFKFALINSEDEIELLPEEFEPYLLEGDEQSIVDLIEDELLLALPMVLAHDNACSDFMAKQEKTIKAEKEASHPFAALKSLKDDLSDKVN